MRQVRIVGDERQPMTPGPLLSAPDGGASTRQAWLHRCMVSLLLRGNAYGLVTARDSMGRPTSITWLHPDDVQPVDDRMPVGDWMVNGQRVASVDLVHIPAYAMPGYRTGLSPVAAYATTLDLGLRAQAYGRDWFRDSRNPSSVLESDQPINAETASAIKARVKAAWSGREPAVLGAGLRWRAVSIAPEESQFLATIKATATQVAAIYGVPPEKIGGEAGGSMTYANVEQQSLDFVTFSLRPWLVRIEQALSDLLPAPQAVRFVPDALIRTDLAGRMSAYRVARDIGLRSVNELRSLEDLPPIPEGGDSYAPLAAPAPAARSMEDAQ
jgi:HK97 family phage portal protein